MRRFAGLSLLLAAIVPLLGVAYGAAVPWDQKLLSLVPPGVELIAGISSTAAPANSGIIFLSSGPSRLDYDDFFALIGADPSRQVSQILLTDSPDWNGQHGMLADGHFDQVRIYKSLTEGGAELANYRGISVVRIEPFARESRNLHEVRWLAILDSKLLLFGAFDMVHQELDRYIDGSAPDPLLAKRSLTSEMLIRPGHFSQRRASALSSGTASSRSTGDWPPCLTRELSSSVFAMAASLKLSTKSPRLLNLPIQLRMRFVQQSSD